MATYAGRAIAYAERVVRGEETAGRYERGVQTVPRRPGRAEHRRLPIRVRRKKPARGRASSSSCSRTSRASGRGRSTSTAKLGYTKIKLEDWQVFIVINLFAWKHAVTGLAVSCARTEGGAQEREIDAGCRHPALHVPRPTPSLARTSTARPPPATRRARCSTWRATWPCAAGFLARFGVTVGKHDITVPTTASSAKPLNAEGSTLDA